MNLSPAAVRNLDLKVVASNETTFETTFFALGSLQEIPSNHSVVSSRISGRVSDLSVIAGDRVTKGDIVVKVESLQPGAPVIELAAPASGIVADSHVRLGEPVDPSKELLDILNLDQLWAVARVPQREAAKIKIGTKARILVPAMGGEPVEGHLIRFGTSADVKSGTFDAIFLVENAEDQLRPGMRAEFSIITSVREDVTVVPKIAVQGPVTDRVVYVQDFDLPNSFMKSSVVTGEENDQFIEIKEGLFPGDEVVTQGAYLLGFAGGGNLSLKEVLDAAHGHEHNEDGSELTEDQKAAKAAGGDEHDHDANAGPVNRFLVAGCLALVALLVLSGLRQLSLERRLRSES
ncbi:efflux RND transporter periplasmic adaptor subunit [Verrucomicrobiaceae bacterium 227]